jgi:hypothetical protein
VIKYKQGKENIVADALLRRYVFISTLDARFLGFEHIKELYKDDRLDGYLFKESLLCVPLSSIYMNCLFANQYSLGGGFRF